MSRNSIGLHAETNTNALASLPPVLTALIEEAVKATISHDAAQLAVVGDPEALASLGRTIAIQEGYLVEAVIAALAASHPERLALTGLRLPLLSAALDLVKKNRQDLYRGLTFDASARSAATYYPDLVIVDRRGRSALIIDVKRSLSSYLGGSKLVELQQRMTASGLILPDLLWRDQQRLAVETVGTAIIDASRVSADVSGGIWSLSRLDELLDIEHAGKRAMDCMEAFRTGVREVWQSAIRSMTLAPLITSTTTPSDTDQTENASRRRGRPSLQNTSAPAPSVVTVGLFQPGARTH